MGWTKESYEKLRHQPYCKIHNKFGWGLEDCSCGANDYLKNIEV